MAVPEAETQTYRFYVPNGDGQSLRDLALLEGSIFSRRLRKAPRPLGTLAGFGAPLAIRRPYNWVEKENLLTLAASVVDPGVVREVIGKDRRLHVHLRQSILPGPEHQVVCWSLHCPPHLISADRITASENTLWQVDDPSADQDHRMVAVAFAGTRLGAAWPTHLDQLLDRAVAPGIQPQTTAALIRWMHLPLLGPSYLPACTHWARSYPAPALTAWLLDQGLPEGLCFSSAGEEWIAAVRQLFWNWDPDPEQARSVIVALDPDDPQPPFAAARCLLRLDPLLMGRIVGTWLQEVVSPQPGRSSISVLVQLLRRQIAGLPDDASDVELRSRQEEVLGQAARAMEVDDRFLEVGIVQPAIRTLSAETLSRVAATNLAVALGVAPFREYLGLRVLDTINHHG